MWAIQLCGFYDTSNDAMLMHLYVMHMYCEMVMHFYECIGQMIKLPPADN